MNTTIGEKLKEAIRKDFPFALYHLPNEKKISVIIQESSQLVSQPFRKIGELRGFFVAPFRGKNINELYCLKPDVFFEDSLANIDLKKAINDLLATSKEVDPAYVMDEKEYTERVAYLVERLKDGDLRKVVMSRVAAYDLPSAFELTRYVLKLIEKYPDAFVYVVSLPGIGTWLGATPEVLLSIVGDYAETVALAGTRVDGAGGWTTKELKEQQIVMDYIEEQLEKHGIKKYDKKGPYTIKAGELLHLKTTYHLPVSLLKGHEGDVISGLHPTPAVCGLPRNKAYELLCQVEKHDRNFYAGFIGPWNLNDESRLFVNLRCAELTGKKLSLFIGGGITAESKPEAEWEETVRKSKTLLSVVEKM